MSTHRRREAEIEYTGQLVEATRRIFEAPKVQGWLKGPPSEWDMTAQDAGIYNALERFMDAASGAHQASDGESPPTAEDAGEVLKQIVSDWVDAFVQNTPDW